MPQDICSARSVLLLNGLLMLGTGIAFHYGSQARRFEHLEKQIRPDYIDEKTTAVLGPMLASLYTGFGSLSVWAAVCFGDPEMRVVLVFVTAMLAYSNYFRIAVIPAEAYVQGMACLFCLGFRACGVVLCFRVFCHPRCWTPQPRPEMWHVRAVGCGPGEMLFVLLLQVYIYTHIY